MSRTKTELNKTTEITKTENDCIDLFEKRSKNKKENAKPIMTDLIRMAAIKPSISEPHNPEIQIHTYQAIKNKKTIDFLEKDLLAEKQKNKE